MKEEMEDRRARYCRMIACLTTSITNWPINAPSPKTMCELIRLIEKGDVTDDHIKFIFIGIELEHEMDALAK